MFPNENKFWNWLMVSSSDPAKASLTVKGILTGVLPFLMVLIHNPNVSNLPNDVYSIVFTFLSLVSGFLTLVGLVRKLYNTYKRPAVPTMPSGIPGM